MPVMRFSVGSDHHESCLDGPDGYVARPWALELPALSVPRRTENEFAWCFECGLISRFAPWEDDPPQCPFCTASPVFCFTWQEACRLNRLLPDAPLIGPTGDTTDGTEFDDV